MSLVYQTITGLKDIDIHCVGPFLHYKDLHILCQTCICIQKLMKDILIYWRTTQYIPLSGIIIPREPIQRVYRIFKDTISDVHNIDYIDVRFGVIMEWYVKFKETNTQTTFVIYPNIKEDKKLNKLFKVLKDNDGVLSMFILHK